MTPKRELTVHPTCDLCGHRMTDHGDRAIGGLCSQGIYPNTCPCPEPRKVHQ